MTRMVCKTFYISCTDGEWEAAKQRAAAEQNRMSAQLDWLMRIIPPSPAWLETFRNQVAFLRDAKVTEMIAEGRYDELFLAYEKLFGLETAEIFLARAVKAWHGAKSVDVTVTVRGPARRL